MWTADDVGQAIVLLALVFLGAALIRKWSRHLRALFVPTAVIGGFLALALGPEGVGRLTDSNGVFPDQTFAVWHALPALLINVMSASLLLGEQLPSPRKTWGIAGLTILGMRRAAPDGAQSRAPRDTPGRSRESVSFCDLLPHVPARSAARAAT
jgi:Na+/glutamate symporter